MSERRVRGASSIEVSGTFYSVVVNVTPRVCWHAKVTHNPFGQLHACLLSDVVEEHLRLLPSRGHEIKARASGKKPQGGVGEAHWNVNVGDRGVRTSAT